MSHVIYRPRPLRRGFSLVELLVVIAIITILAGITTPAVQMVRASARRAQCQNNIKQIGNAALQYHTLHSQFPSGYLGPADANGLGTNVRFPSGNPTETQLGVMVQLLPHLDAEVVQREITRIPISIKRTHASDTFWYNNAAAKAAGARKLEVMLCPEVNSSRDTSGTIIASHIYVDGSNPPNIELKSQVDNTLGRSNYLGVAGLMGATQKAPANPLGGIFYNRSAVKQEDIRDGASNTLMFGESLGSMVANQLEYSHTWMGSGIAPSNNGIDKSVPYAFNSAHNGVVFFCAADGAVISINDNIPANILQVRCGIADSTPF
ncbi:DUF1559 family PulG-like putative transporter [Lignipirellula cremea]|uniref:Putative major pilin subunit n=1 Tax=Lignipirellula cremea TaxID=2528010 RepID=A0A518DZQ3_9BACT|nr:DUF1559 domain-containing protein [Lignipirellula cremea]QDU97313.1 putative major pilin subunit [Lignipirellula cremea]